MKLKTQLVVLGLATLTSLAVPAARLPLLLVTNWLAVALVVAGVLHRRPARRLLWALVTVFAVLVAVGNTGTALTGGDDPVTSTATFASQLVAAAALPLLLGGGRPGPRRSRERGGALELTVHALVVGLVCAELLLQGVDRHREEAMPWSLALAPGIDALLLGALLWVLHSRSRLLPAMALIVAGGLGCLTYDLVVTLSGDRVALGGDPVQALGVANMLLFGLAALHPSMTALGGARALRHVRRPSNQLLLLVPTALVPVLLLGAHALGAGLRLHVAVLTAVSALVTLAVLLRALAVLRETERGAEHDPLTGLLNRRGLTRAYARTAGSSGATGTGSRMVVWIDLDDFKHVNDRYGHSSGDTLLITTATRLREAVGDRGVVARHGGDEFIVLLDSFPDVEAVGRAALRVLGDPVDVGGRALSVTASIGVVEAAPGDDLERVLADADIAMYAAKRSGKSTTQLFQPDLREEALTAVALVEDLRALLREGDASAGELFVVYQPVVDLADGSVSGAEALARWRHPLRGVVPPDDFLGLAEHEGLGAVVDELVLHRALAQLRRWEETGHRGLSVSVNLGRSSMCDPQLAERVLDALTTHRVPAQQLHLEITEHDALPDDEEIRTSLHRLVDAGVSVSLDDFGVGYTSLSYLRRYPVGVLKLDRSLVEPDDATARSLRAGITALATSLGLAVVAEGIETAAQAEEARRLGVRFGQGYHFARPLEADAFAGLLARDPAPEHPAALTGPRPGEGA
ncbi:bifunctional diguanylate cyclase/phosphodiesterase [Paenibacillus sp. TRM 82003]|uniref:putative bifunctional diguanylate cyclase/phosphodiesterase n=1 Tax=Kineococcus sp. TRM81007 TaxID=2925831 RepID=UPI001F567A73|nr:bifunctional diguanylate cyclase/phosphodiesterase [Kineococcus sp. TRM81007]MCI2237419.1 bifunctional diguanylate cyclase/phosphodiesterase [Kineococcus sp. TRM81007]MCI3919770.1 bifunctional diguanylate cyclase/phosphodiesterase [Paenibacillus sp. TRM 82003]